MLQKTPQSPIDTIQDYMDKNSIYRLIYDHLPSLVSITPKLKQLYALGDQSLLQKSKIAIVGPRYMSEYGKKILDRLFQELSQYDIVTVSGGARGVDTYVHELSLYYNIPTVVVLGGGIGWYYKTGNKHFLAHIVEAGGLLVSEYDIFMSPQKYTFPYRNRIIAGLGDLIFLPEAGLASGSLITVDKALQFGKSVYAPMQDIFVETSLGTNTYITQGKIHPLGSIEGFLDSYCTKKAPETLGSTVLNSPKTQRYTKKRGISPSLSVSGSLVEQSMLELGL